MWVGMWMDGDGDVDGDGDGDGEEEDMEKDATGTSTVLPPGSAASSTPQVQRVLKQAMEMGKGKEDADEDVDDGEDLGLGNRSFRKGRMDVVLRDMVAWDADADADAAAAAVRARLAHMKPLIDALLGSLAKGAYDDLDKEEILAELLRVVAVGDPGLAPIILFSAFTVLDLRTTSSFVTMCLVSARARRGETEGVTGPGVTYMAKWSSTWDAFWTSVREKRESESAKVLLFAHDLVECIVDSIELIMPGTKAAFDEDGAVGGEEGGEEGDDFDDDYSDDDDQEEEEEEEECA